MFIDLLEAFDTVRHKQLLEKLHDYEIKGKALEILLSFFGDEKY